MSNPRTTPSNPAFIPTIGNLKCILQDQECVRIVYQREALEQCDEALQDPTHTLDQAFESLGCKGPPQSPIPRSQSALAASNMKVEHDLRLGKQLRCTVVQGAKRECTRRCYEAMQQAAENVLSDLFITSLAKIEKGINYTHIDVLRLYQQPWPRRKRWARSSITALKAGRNQLRS